MYIGQTMRLEYHFLISLFIFKGSASDLERKICLMDGMAFVLRRSDCQPVNNKNLNNALKHREERCSDPCYFELAYTVPYHDYCVIRNVELQFMVDRIPITYHQEKCKERENMPHRCVYDFKLVCYKSYVKENSDIGSLCLRDNHCSSEHKLQCHNYANWNTSPYGFCKCRTEFVELNRTCLTDNSTNLFRRHGITKQEKSETLHLILAILGGVVIGISLTVVAVFILMKKKLWKHFDRRGQINNVTNALYRGGRINDVTNNLYRGNDSRPSAEEVLPCEENDIYNAINEYAYAEPKEHTEGEEEQQRSCSGKRPYNHLFENEQKMCENYNEYEYPSDENYKDLKRFSSDSVKNIEAGEYFTLEKT